MDKSNYFIKRFITEHPFPADEWVFFVMKDGFKKIGRLSDDKRVILCVGKTKVIPSEIEYWIENI